MVLQARAVVSILEPGMRDPTFGILQFKALTHVDKVERTVYFEDVRIVNANFPSSPSKKAEYSKLWLALGGGGGCGGGGRSWGGGGGFGGFGGGGFGGFRGGFGGFRR